MFDNICCLLLVDADDKESAIIRDKIQLSKLKIGEVVVATSLAQALCAIAAKSVDVILLDMDLENLKSLQTLKAIRTVTDKVIIILAQTDDEMLGIEAIKAGADDFLVKGTVNSESLRRSIIHSNIRLNIRNTVCKINYKMEKLTQLGEGSK